MKAFNKLLFTLLLSISWLSFASAQYCTGGGPTSANDSNVDLTVDFTDRESMTNNEYYPWPLEKEAINLKLKEVAKTFYELVNSLYSFIYVPVEVNTSSFTKLENTDLQKL